MKPLQLTQDDVPDGAYLVDVGPPPGEGDWCDGLNAIGWPPDKKAERGPTALVQIQVMLGLEDGDLERLQQGQPIVATFWGGIPPMSFYVATGGDVTP